MVAKIPVVPVKGVFDLGSQVLNLVRELRENCSHEMVVRCLGEGTLLETSLCLFCSKEGEGVGPLMTDVVGVHVITLSRDEYNSYKELLPYLINLHDWS